eukprot:15474846-Alexandrium_andersonii.AAC.1
MAGRIASTTPTARRGPSRPAPTPSPSSPSRAARSRSLCSAAAGSPGTSTRARGGPGGVRAVSYTHLALPTICSV